MKTLCRFMETFHLLFAQLPDGFNIFRESVEDEARAGRPRTSVIDSSVEKAEELIEEDPTITLRFLALELGISCGSAHAIIHDPLGRSKRCTR